MTLEEFHNPQLVALFETVNQYDPGTQPDCYLAIAQSVSAGSVIDLGCGSGTVTQVFASSGLKIEAVDPSAPLIALARQRRGCERVRWIVGTASDIGTTDADFAMMTGHVAQFFLDDDEWNAALAALRTALRPGGLLVFESRNPEARGWHEWVPANTRTVHDPAVGAITHWSEWHDIDENHVVRYTNHYRIEATGEVLVAHAALRFRSATELCDSLTAAGFVVRSVWGDYAGAPASASRPELVVTAERR
ncbi:MAG: class I SAM-dependent methyltransferase [Acidimicrobiia bacterium]